MRGITVRLTLAQYIEAEYTSAAWEALTELIRAVHLGQPLPPETGTDGSQAVELHLPVIAGAEQCAYSMAKHMRDVAYTFTGHEALKPASRDQLLLPGVTGPVSVTHDTHPGEPWPTHGHLVVLYVDDRFPYPPEDQELLILAPRAPAGPAQ